MISGPWPWYLGGPLLGLTVPLLLLLGNKRLGISSSYRHICSAVLPVRSGYLKYDWKSESWNLLFTLGLVLGGFLAVRLLPNPDVVQISARTRADLLSLGLTENDGLVPRQIFSWSNLLSLQGIVFMVLGGFLVGFGTRYADGCTAGHAIMGLSNFEKSALIAVFSFFAGGLLVTHAVFPILF